MIRTWIADITPLYEKDIYEKYYDEMPLFRKEKADRIRDAHQRAQSIGAWALYQKAVLQCKEMEPVFNLSHSGQYVLCSAEDDLAEGVKVGCDIEEINQFHSKLINKYFCPSEVEYIFNQSNDEAKTKAFYRYWVLKESFMKATRYGMRLALNAFEIQCVSDDNAILIRKPEQFPEAFYYKEYELHIPFRIAVCSTSNQFAKEIQKVRL